MAARHEVLRPSTKMTNLTAFNGLALKEIIAAYGGVFSRRVTDHGVILGHIHNYIYKYIQ